MKSQKSKVKSQKFKEILTVDKKGFTIIELIMVIVITGIIAGITAMLLLQVMNVYSFVTVREVILSDGELAMGRMSREIRQIEDVYSIYKADSEEIEFEDAYYNLINFRRSGGSLLRNSDELATDLTSLTFQYTTSDGNPPVVNDPATPEEEETNIKRIQINLTIKKGDEEIALQSQVYPRNL
ncbi:MAG: prepilin-type N-terminal cleavage/methylation domain-containing protein [bacterium]|nr:prepilin-type N-terminal cleavage/methylation domain-containing protein [bacterium]